MKSLILIASKQAIALFLALFCISNVMAQAITRCGSTLTTVERANYVQRHNQPPASSLVSQTSTAAITLPIQFWIVKDNAGTNYPTPSVQVLDAWLTQVSQNYNFINMGNFSFLRCGVSIINNSLYTNLASPYNLNRAYFNPNALNIYIVADFGAEGRGYWPDPTNPINNMVIIDDFSVGNVNLLTHEIGHAFDLLHTHEGADLASLREQVDRENEASWRFKGDLLKDTPADYGPDGTLKVVPSSYQASCNNDGCATTGCLVKDDSNTPLTPDFTNYMSYHAFSCQTHFSPEQKNKIIKTLTTNPLRSVLITPNICRTPAYGILETQCPAMGRLQNANVNLTYQNGTYPCGIPYSQSSSGGEFLFPCQLITTNSLTINPTKTTDYTNGVTAYDISLLTYHILGITTISDPYKLIAADVDNNAEIDGADQLHMRNLVLRKTTTFPNNVGSWRFIPNRYLQSTAFVNALNALNTGPFSPSTCITYNGISYCYSGPNSYMDKITLPLSSSDATQNDSWSFRALKVGDINCSVVNTAARMAPNTLSNLDNKAVTLKSGKEATVLIKTKYAGKISSFQAGFNFTNSAIQITSIEKGDFNSSNDVMDYIKLDKGEIRALWYNEKAKAKNFTGGVTIMKMKVKALKDIADLLAVLSLDEAVLQSEFYDDKNMRVTLPLTLEADGTNAPIADDAYSVKVYPNPFTNTVTLEVTSATKENANLTIVSAMGALLYNKKADLEVGVNTITIENTSTFPTGVLSYNLKFGNRTLNGTLNKAR
jgi:hypothetical protein